MVTQISFGQAQAELSGQEEFFLDLSPTCGEVNIFGLFQDVCFCLSSHPYAVFRNEASQVTIRDIQEVWRDDAGGRVRYWFLCGISGDSSREQCFCVQCKGRAA